MMKCQSTRENRERRATSRMDMARASRSSERARRASATWRSVVAGENLPPSCEYGTWTFAGSDEKRRAAKYRCPSGECARASVWLKADRLHTLIPRESARWNKLYRSRGAVERGFGRLKNESGLLRLRSVAGPGAVHADLTILGSLAVALRRPEPFHTRRSATTAFTTVEVVEAEEQALVRFLRTEHGVSVGNRTAREIIAVLLSPEAGDEDIVVELRAQDAANGEPRTVITSRNEVRRTIS